MNAISVLIVGSALYTVPRSYRRRAAELPPLLVAEPFRAEFRAGNRSSRLSLDGDTPGRGRSM